ncbi:sesquipedalian-1-like isoform X2 [Watersipora subatra]
MKLLNEANLVYFSTSTSQTTKEGWLSKRGEMNKNFQKRWFVLKGNLLFYFDKPGDREPNGVIILEGYTVELADMAVEGYTFKILFKGASNSRKYLLQAESQDVMVEWMKAITCASYDYMKLMVAELKSQLDDLSSEELANELADCKEQDPSVDVFGHKPFTVPDTPMIQTLEIGGADQIPLPTEQKPKARLNPFGSSVSNPLDPFDLVLSQAEPVGVHNSEQASLEVPKARKKKSSPKLSRKMVPSPKNIRRAAECLAKGKTPLHSAEADTRCREPAPPLRVQVSRFLELHSLYGDIIRAMLPQKLVEESSPALIEF